MSDTETNSIFQELYDSEINFTISCFWDGGFEVRVGDKMNGWRGDFQVYSWDEVAPELEKTAIHVFPNSRFVRNRKSLQEILNSQPAEKEA